MKSTPLGLCRRQGGKPPQTRAASCRRQAMATRSRTQIFLRYRDTLRTHKRGPRTNVELREFKVHKNLLAAQSDDEGSTVDARTYSVPPVWVTMVDDMNRDISQIKIKSMRPLAPHSSHPQCLSFFSRHSISLCRLPQPCCLRFLRLTDCGFASACVLRHSLRIADSLGQGVAARLC